MTRWQKKVTLKAIRENKVPGFDTGYIATPADMAGTMLPEFRPHWLAQELGDGTMGAFDTIQETQTWIREWGDIGE